MRGPQELERDARKTAKRRVKLYPPDQLGGAVKLSST